METTNALKSIRNNPRLRWTQVGPTAFEVAGMLHMETAESFRQLLLTILAHASTTDFSESRPAQLNLSQVDICGTPGIQLLLSAERTMAAMGVSLEFTAPSAVIEQVFARFGMNGPFSKCAETGASER